MLIKIDEALGNSVTAPPSVARPSVGYKWERNAKRVLFGGQQMREVAAVELPMQVARRLHRAQQILLRETNDENPFEFARGWREIADMLGEARRTYARTRARGARARFVG